MSLMPVYFSTNRTKKRKAKSKTRAQIAAELDHAKFRVRMGLTKSKTQVADLPEFREVISEHVPMSHSIPCGLAAKPKPNVYSGERKLLGIATMHKSCLVPVFNESDAVDIAKMRRG